MSLTNIDCGLDENKQIEFLNTRVNEGYKKNLFTINNFKLFASAMKMQEENKYRANYKSYMSSYLRKQDGYEKEGEPSLEKYKELYPLNLGKFGYTIVGGSDACPGYNAGYIFKSWLKDNYAGPYNEDAFNLASKEEIIIRPRTTYVFLHNKTLTREEYNKFKMNICLNFFFNWKPWRTNCSNGKPGFGSGSHIFNKNSTWLDNLYKRPGDDEFSNNDVIIGEADALKTFLESIEDLPGFIESRTATEKSHILFYTVQAKNKDYKKGLYKEEIASTIKGRFCRNLITVILFKGTKEEFEALDLESDLNVSDFIYEDLNLNDKKTSEEAKKKRAREKRIEKLRVDNNASESNCM